VIFLDALARGEGKADRPIFPHAGEELGDLFQ
jgi:hypothetical protein